jgi:hypothetical protein
MSFYHEMTSKSRFLVKFFHPVSERNIQSNLRDKILDAIINLETNGDHHYIENDINPILADVVCLLDREYRHNLVDRHGCVIAYIYNPEIHSEYVHKQIRRNSEFFDGCLMVGFSCVNRKHITEVYGDGSYFDGKADLDSFDKNLGFQKALHNSHLLRDKYGFSQTKCVIEAAPRSIRSVVESMCHRASSYFKLATPVGESV